MKTVITITEMASMPGRYVYAIKVGGASKTRDRSGHDAGNDPSAAAAKAVELSIMYGSAGFHIFAPAKVMEFLPNEFRCG